MKSTLPVRYTWKDQVWLEAHLFTTRFTECFKATVEIYCSEGKTPFKIFLLIDKAPGHPRSQMEPDSKMKGVFLAANTTSLLQPMDPGVTSAFKSYYLRNTFRKAVAVVDSDS